MKNMNRFLLFIRSQRAKNLPHYLGLFDILFPSAIYAVGILLFPDNEQVLMVFRGMATFVFLLLCGLIGLIYIARKEVDTLFVVRGKAAEIYGVLITLTSLVLIILALLRTLNIIK